MFHNEVQKEIGRRQTMEEHRQQRTAADLRSGGLPSNIPEMSAQQATAPEKTPPEVFEAGKPFAPPIHW